MSKLFLDVRRFPDVPWKYDLTNRCLFSAKKGGLFGEESIPILDTPYLTPTMFDYARLIVCYPSTKLELVDMIHDIKKAKTFTKIIIEFLRTDIPESGYRIAPAVTSLASAWSLDCRSRKLYTTHELHIVKNLVSTGRPVYIRNPHITDTLWMAEEFGDRIEGYITDVPFMLGAYGIALHPNPETYSEWNMDFDGLRQADFPGIVRWNIRCYESWCRGVIPDAPPFL